MNCVIEVKLVEKFGRKLVYPVNDQAILITKITNTKTLTPRMLSELSKMGFEIKWFAEFLTYKKC